MNFQRILTSIAKKPYILCDISREGSGPAVPPLDPCMPKQILFLSDEKYQGMAMEADVYIIAVCAVPSYLFAFHQGT